MHLRHTIFFGARGHALPIWISSRTERQNIHIGKDMYIIIME